MKFKVVSNGFPNDTRFIEEESGFVFPVISLTYTAAPGEMGVLKLELLAHKLPGFRLELSGEAAKKSRDAAITASAVEDAQYGIQKAEEA